MFMELLARTRDLQIVGRQYHIVRRQCQLILKGVFFDLLLNFELSHAGGDIWKAIDWN